MVAAKPAISAAASHAAVSEPAITPAARPSSVAINSHQASAWKRRPSIPKVAIAARLEPGLASLATLAPASTPRGSVAPQPRARGQPIATIRSIGTFARSAISGGTLTSTFISRSESRSFGSVIIFMYLQKAIRLASIRFACGAACCSG